MVGEGVLIDLSQMSERAIADTLALLDHLDPSDEVPAIFTHGAFRFGGFIKPTMGRLESAADLAALEPALRDRYGQPMPSASARATRCASYEPAGGAADAGLRSSSARAVARSSGGSWQARQSKTSAEPW